jgi:hypothetical protein
VRSIVWVFLAPGCFATMTPIMTVGFPFISLDSLVRIYTYQWVTRRKPSKVFLGTSGRGGQCGGINTDILRSIRNRLRDDAECPPSRTGAAW